MLSYRHAFHAGNHADVFKHMTLTLLLRALLRKEKPFFYLDTHAGAGRYPLGSTMAQKNREHETGIRRLWHEKSPPEAIAHYLEAVRTTNPARELKGYPGSPRIARHFMRERDRMALCELHPSDARLIAHEFSGDRQVRVMQQDGYQAIKSLLPPVERRGLVHIDPAYELRDERKRVLEAVSEGYRRWATGIFAIWFPIQDRATADDFLRRFKRLGVAHALVAELGILPDEPFRLNGSGMIIINPPWQLDQQLRSTLPWLWQTLSNAGQGGWRVTDLSAERPAAEPV
jgi:23S rRNA (adenine2030-N6)-methyltransferase